MSLFSAVCGSQEMSPVFIGEDVDFEAVLSDLPSDITIETAGVDDIASLPFFTREAARSFVAWRDSAGTANVRKELDAFSELNARQKIVLISLLGRNRKETRRDPVLLTVRSGGRSDFDSGVDGTPYYSRLTAETGRFHFNLMFDRDAGEPRALDYLSGNTVWRDARDRLTIIAGDYRPGFGQGLVWSKYGRVYASGTAAEIREPSAFENRMFEETRFLRGAFVSCDTGILRVVAWGSNRRLDATLDDSGDAVTIRESGVHFDDDARANLGERIAGARIAYESNPIVSLGFMASTSEYSPVIARKDDERHLTYPEGSVFRYVSTDGRIGNNDASVFWEHVRMGADAYATIGGVSVKKGMLSLAGVGRYYGKRFWARHSGALNSFGATGNEKGAYAAASIRPSRSIRAQLSCDLARTLTRTYSEPMPESRNRYLMSIEMRPVKTIETTCSFRATDESGAGDDRWSSRVHTRKRFSGKSKIDEIRAGAAISGSRDGKGPIVESGVRVAWIRMRIDCSFWWFGIPSYAARYYSFIRDVPGRGRMEPFWGDGAGFALVAAGERISIRYRYVDSDLMRRDRELTVQIDATL